VSYMKSKRYSDGFGILAEPAWSEPVCLTEYDIKRLIPDKCGVYRIRAFTRSGKARALSRCNAVDPAGILHIGESVKLRTHILNFLAEASRPSRPRHSAGGEYCRSKFGKRFPLDRLRCEFLAPLSKPQAVELKRNFQRLYRREFLDNPPLDAGIGAKSLWEPADPPELGGPRFRAHEREDA
jgi:hypothetical protein